MKQLILFLLISVNFIVAEELYYKVELDDEMIGYLQTKYTEAEYQNKKAYVRESWSVFNVQNSKYIIDEKTIYNRNTNRVELYLLNYQKDLSTQQQQYFFNENSVKVLTNAKDPKTSTELPLRRELTIVTDYFSLLPLLAQCQDFPISFFTVEPKNINTLNSHIPTSKITISPLGIRKIKIMGEMHVSYAFHMQKQDSSKVTFWVSREKDKILRIKQHQKNSTIIELTDDSVVDLFAPGNDSKTLPKIRSFPFDMGKMYRYIAKIDGKKVGTVEFFLRFDDEKKTYHMTTVGNFVPSKISYTSQTEYNEELLPISYEMKQQGADDSKNVVVKCEFKKRGVKVYYQKDVNIVERLVPLSASYVFLDNNSYHHFAVFASQLPFSLEKNLAVDIFHPRRMQVTKASFEKENDAFKLRTPFYSLQLWIDDTGKMIRYEQGKLVAELENK